LKVGKTKRGKGTKIMAVADRHGLPVSICIESATPHEVTLVVPDAPGHLIGDNAYDSDKLDVQLRHYGIEVIAPAPQQPKNQKTRRTLYEAIPSALENRKTICLVAEFSAPGRAV
jgi:hypothetical protein